MEKLRLLCSHGGRIVSIDRHVALSYIGGETRIVSLDRCASISDLKSRLSKTLLSGKPFFLKYQTPDQDLYSLISVKTDEDLENMIDEYDCAARNQSRIRLFLFPIMIENLHSGDSVSDSQKSGDWFANTEAADGGKIEPMLNSPNLQEIGVCNSEDRKFEGSGAVNSEEFQFCSGSDLVSIRVTDVDDTKSRVLGTEANLEDLFVNGVEIKDSLLGLESNSTITVPNLDEGKLGLLGRTGNSDDWCANSVEKGDSTVVSQSNSTILPSIIHIVDDWKVGVLGATGTSENWVSNTQLNHHELKDISPSQSDSNSINLESIRVHNVDDPKFGNEQFSHSSALHGDIGQVEKHTVDDVTNLPYTDLGLSDERNLTSTTPHPQTTICPDSGGQLLSSGQNNMVSLNQIYPIPKNNTPIMQQVQDPTHALIQSEFDKFQKQPQPHQFIHANSYYTRHQIQPTGPDEIPHYYPIHTSQSNVFFMPLEPYNLPPPQSNLTEPYSFTINHSTATLHKPETNCFVSSTNDSAPIYGECMNQVFSDEDRLDVNTRMTQSETGHIGPTILHEKKRTDNDVFNFSSPDSGSSDDINFPNKDSEVQLPSLGHTHSLSLNPIYPNTSTIYNPNHNTPNTQVQNPSYVLPQFHEIQKPYIQADAHYIPHQINPAGSAQIPPYYHPVYPSQSYVYVFPQSNLTDPNFTNNPSTINPKSETNHFVQVPPGQQFFRYPQVHPHVMSNPGVATTKFAYEYADSNNKQIYYPASQYNHNNIPASLGTILPDYANASMQKQQMGTSQPL